MKKHTRPLALSIVSSIGHLFTHGRIFTSCRRSGTKFSRIFKEATVVKTQIIHAGLVTAHLAASRVQAPMD